MDGGWGKRDKCSGYRDNLDAFLDYTDWQLRWHGYKQWVIFKSLSSRHEEGNRKAGSFCHNKGIRVVCIKYFIIRHDGDQKLFPGLLGHYYAFLLKKQSIENTWKIISLFFFQGNLFSFFLLGAIIWRFRRSKTYITGNDHRAKNSL